MLKFEWGKRLYSRQPRDLPKNKQIDSLIAKLNLLFLRGMLRRVRC
jgi:hypothetical protein